MERGRQLGRRRRMLGGLRALAMRAGLDIKRAGPGSSVAALRRLLLSQHRIGLLVDGGANVGQYGLEARRAGYRGRIVSLEPQTAAFAELERNAAADRAWSCARLALGDADGEAELLLAANSVSSSLLVTGDRHLEAAPGSGTIGTETVQVRRLDSIAPEIGLDRGSPPAYLKLDLQGFELPALRGASGCIERIAAVEAEVSLVETYRDGTLLPELFSRLESAGFECAGIFPAFAARSSDRVLQADAVFERPGARR